MCIVARLGNCVVIDSTVHITFVSNCQGINLKIYIYSPLIMSHVQGNMVLKAPFKPQSKELVVMPYQVALLMLFNESDVLSFEEIRERLKLTDDDTLRTLGSLACAKHAILLVEGHDAKKRPKKPSKTDKFRVNWNFQDKLVRCALYVCICVVCLGGGDFKD